MALWLFVVSALIVLMVVFGGWVRLTHSGLSMSEWHVVSGVLPPLSSEAWSERFHQYQQTPEYKKINAGISLDEFHFIYYMEYAHRLLGRVTGLAFVLPLLFFLGRGDIVRRRAPVYCGVGLLFALQGLAGWLMVKSGLVDSPHVSPYRLTLHLLCALALLAACLWLGFEHTWAPGAAPGVSPRVRKLSVALLLAIGLQMAAGALVAGFRAGYVSATFPRMFGAWIPEQVWALKPWMANLLANPIMVHFQHRWMAFVPALLALALILQVRREPPLPYLRSSIRFLGYLLLFQLLLGIALVVLQVPVLLASLHQLNALVLFVLALFICHRAFRTRGDFRMESRGT